MMRTLVVKPNAARPKIAVVILILRDRARFGELDGWINPLMLFSKRPAGGNQGNGGMSRVCWGYLYLGWVRWPWAPRVWCRRCNSRFQ